MTFNQVNTEEQEYQVVGATTKGVIRTIGKALGRSKEALQMVLGASGIQKTAQLKYAEVFGKNIATDTVTGERFYFR